MEYRGSDQGNGMAMKAVCECGVEFFTEEVRCICPLCRAHIVLIQDDGELLEHDLVLARSRERIRLSIAKHGNWDDYSIQQVFDAIGSEFEEYCEAVVTGTVNGPHGQIDELLDVVATAVKGIRRLQCL